MRTPTKSLFVIALFLLLMIAGARADVPHVVVIDVHGPIWAGQAQWITTQINDAWKGGAAGIILDLDTTSGSSDAAQQIKQTIISRTNDLPIAAYVHDHATGPGCLIPLACKTLAMSPGATLGGAPSDASKAEFSGTAQATGRIPAYAAAFISADGPLPRLNIQRGDSLTLTAPQAKTVGYADVIATDYPAVLQQMNLANAGLTRAHLSPLTAVALWVSQPWATILLLALGLALVIAEMLTLHSWGIAGIIGGLLVALIFAAHIMVGAGTWVGILLFLGGVALVLFEAHIPGHGLFVLGGLALVFTGIYFALGGTQSGALYSTMGAAVVTIGILVAFLLYLPRSPIWKKVGQPMRQSATAGYVSSEDYTGLLGQVGTAATLLRPSGTAEFDGVRVAVVSEGGFIAAGTRVQVIYVQGNRIVVRDVAPPA